MDSKKSYFSISGALIKEDIKNYWIIPFLGVLMGLLGVILPITMGYEDGSYTNMANYIDNLLDYENVVTIMMVLAMPICAAMSVFKYLHRSPSTTSMHAMPFSRTRLFNSNVIAGFILAIIPVVITGLGLLAICKPTYFSWDYSEGVLGEDAVNVFTYSRILKWMLVAVVTELYVYAWSVLASIVAGTQVIAGLLSFVFNGIVYCIVLPVLYFATSYIIGYVFDFESLLKLHPIIGVIDVGGGPVTAATLIIYVVVALVLIVAADVLYRNRKNERTEDAVTFKWMITFLCDLATLCGAILFGVYFGMIGDGGSVLTYVGYAVGALITYLISRMILTKTVRIFNVQSVKEFGICVLIIVLLIVGFKVDAMGIAKKVPSSSQVDYVAFVNPANYLYDGYDRYDLDYFNVDTSDYERFNSWSDIMYKDPENIQAVIDLHKAIIANRKDVLRDYAEDYYTEDSTMDNRVSYYTFDIGYKMGNDKLMRQYSVDQNWLMQQDALAKLYESDEFKNRFALDNLSIEKMHQITVINNITGDSYTVQGDECTELLEALNQDFRERTFAQEMDGKDSCYAHAELSFYTGKNNVKAEPMPENVTYDYDFDKYYESNYMDIYIRNTDVHTIAFLEKQGKADVLKLDYNKVAALDMNIDGEFMGAIKDPAVIRQVLEASVGDYPSGMDWNQYYEVAVYTNTGENKRYTAGELQEKWDAGKITDSEYDRLISDECYDCAVYRYVMLQDAPDNLF